MFLIESGQVDLKVLAQPYREAVSAQTFLTSSLEDSDIRDVLIVSAWLRESGVELLVPGLDAVKRRGGSCRLFFGVDLGGTTRQGVSLARQHVRDLYVVHDPSGRTFHPKMYMATGRRVGYALIGSNNLTAGGLWHNYEGALMAIFDPVRESDIADGLRGYAKRLLEDRAICKRVTAQVFRRLATEGWLVDETADRRRRNEDQLPSSASTGRGKHAGKPLFSASDVEKRSRAAPIRTSKARPASKTIIQQVAIAPDSWWKPLGAGDAQRPLVGNPTGNVALTRVPMGQDRATFFRKVFFGAANWRRSNVGGKTSEFADIAAEVVIGGDALGQHMMTVVYRPYRSIRGRATTVLRWGESLLQVLHRRDVADWYLLIERADVHTYRLTIIPTQPV